MAQENLSLWDTNRLKWWSSASDFTPRENIRPAPSLSLSLLLLSHCDQLGMKPSFQEGGKVKTGAVMLFCSSSCEHNQCILDHIQGYLQICGYQHEKTVFPRLQKNDQSSSRKWISIQCVIGLKYLPPLFLRFHRRGGLFWPSLFHALSRTHVVGSLFSGDYKIISLCSHTKTIIFRSKNGWQSLLEH